jgi:hypothetical protein
MVDFPLRCCPLCGVRTSAFDLVLTGTIKQDGRVFKEIIGTQCCKCDGKYDMEGKVIE